MLNLERTGLILLHPVRINRNLRKYKLDEQREERYDSFINNAFITDGELISRNISLDVWNGVPFNIKYDFLRSKWKRKLTEYYIKVRMMIHNTVGVKFDQEEFFAKVKSSVKELESVDEETINKFKDNLVKFYDSHQKVLATKLKHQITLIENENILVENNFVKYFNEEDIVDFVKKSEAGITLVEIDYFPYDIPENVVEEMMRAEELGIFDNYYVLYMSNKDVVKQINTDVAKSYTNEVEKKKDPILFGVMEGSTKLYYIGDWLTDYCNIDLKYLENLGYKPNKLIKTKNI